MRSGTSLKLPTVVRRALALALLTVLATACGGKNGGDTLTFGVEAEPVALDGALAPDVESRRVVSQIFEGLVGLRPGTTELEPRLATSWRAGPTGRVWTFELRDGVRFQDGTLFNARAVCFNFDRWFHFTGPQRALRVSYYWQRAFGGFAGQPSLYRRCIARGAGTVVLELTRPSAAFLSALALPAFSIASPASLGGLGRPADTGQPVGTGPYRLGSWVRGDRLTLVRNDDYWGEPAKLRQIVFRLMPGSGARLRALQRGEIAGYDLVQPQEVTAVEHSSDLRLLERPPFNVGYVTINAARPPMDKLLVRQAVAYGLDRARLADSFQPREAASVAAEFQPPDVFGYAADVPQYRFDPKEARRLLRLAGLTLPVRIELWYPTDVSRPYLPDPARGFAILARGLKAAGFKVVARSAPWDGDYLIRVDEGRAGHLSLVGWTGDFPDPSDFLGTFFRQPTRQFGFNDPRLFSLLDRAEREPDRARRAQLYQDANRRIMELLPGVPLVHTEQFLALRADVRGYITSPVSLEPFAIVSLSS